MMSVRPFEENDTDHIKARVDKYSASEQTIEFLACNGKAYTFTKNDKPVAILGGSLLCQGCWQIWALMSENIRSEGLYLTKVAKSILDIFAKLNNIHRYHCIIDIEVEENIKWIKLLGFKYESTLVMATSQKTDVLMYVMFPNGGSYVKWRKYGPTRLRSDVAKLFGLVS